MLTVHVPGFETYSDELGFVDWPDHDLKIEHSLTSLSEWESKWNVPYLTDDRHTQSMYRDYVRCMDLSERLPYEYYQSLPYPVLKKCLEYINEPMTATTVTTLGTGGVPPSSEKVTSELVYYWMIACEIPFEADKWNLNRLLMLIRVCNAKNNPKKMTSAEAGAMQARLNAQRLKMKHR